MNERRTHQRNNIACAFILVKNEGATIWNTVDISESGAKMEQPETPLSPGESFELTFSLSVSEFHTARAEVVRCDNEFVSVRFEEELDNSMLSKALAA